MTVNQKGFELRIKCGGDVKSFGVISCEDEKEAKATDNYKTIVKLAECCKYKNSEMERCCEVELVDLNSESYIVGLETPCGSNTEKADKIQTEQASHETSLGFVVIVFLLGIAVIASMFVENYNDALIYTTIFLTWVIFSFNMLSKYFGGNVERVKTVLSFIVMVIAFHKLGAFSSFFG